MSDSAVRGPSGTEPVFSTLIQFVVYLLLIFLCVGEPVPAVNESHYLPKAKHLWDRQFAPGDLFLDSHDSHFLASALAGITARVLPLEEVAWLGRLLSWGLLAWAWLSLSRRVQLPPRVRGFALVGWLLALRWGHWAGEWAAGGFEAKTIAYPLVLLGLASTVASDWKRVWLWMGAAMAWHPVVGGWAGLSVGIAWMLQPHLLSRIGPQIPWLIGGAGLALLGVVPAISGLSGPDVIDRVSAAQVHVYLRLPHHLSPQLFAPERHLAATISLTVFLAATLLWRRTRGGASFEQSRGVDRLLLSAWIAVLFAVLGLAIDGMLSRSRPDIAAKLLRFYWFRWADVVVPLASSIVIWRLLVGPWLANDAATGRATLPRWRSGVIALGVVATAAGIVSRLQLGETQIIPAADRMVVQSVGRIPIATDRYVDWLAVCAWIRENTPPDSLWLTPKYQQSFKWYAQRAEVVCWKDVPQDNASVIEWYHRIERCAPPRDATGVIRDWTQEELLSLSAQYGCRWVLLDRTYQSTPPALEIMYPRVENGQVILNRSFAVMRIPDSLLDSSRRLSP